MKQGSWNIDVMKVHFLFFCIYCRNKCLLIFKCLNGLAPSYLADKIKFVSEVNPYHSRNAINNALFIPKLKTELFRYTLVYFGPSHWNTLPHEITSAKGIIFCKQKLKIFLMEQQTKENSKICKIDTS